MDALDSAIGACEDALDFLKKTDKEVAVLEEDIATLEKRIEVLEKENCELASRVVELEEVLDTANNYFTVNTEPKTPEEIARELRSVLRATG